jgi:hypothetical protein
MQNELEAKLCEICNELHMLYGCRQANALDRIRTLESMKEWIEGLIANYCE